MNQDFKAANFESARDLLSLNLLLGAREVEEHLDVLLARLVESVLRHGLVFLVFGREHGFGGSLGVGPQSSRVMLRVHVDGLDMLGGVDFDVDEHENISILFEMRRNQVSHIPDGLALDFGGDLLKVEDLVAVIALLESVLDCLENSDDGSGFRDLFHP
eukprot:CAMPEP_0170494876 /NCGR_PEP_ID=MMETSP0208-20121228/14892_1 /TAXON_ID=197538 /ORGANISM="Strombidium inclinatum, Strain S3" /LENGTH=158 /DNA_ID=CAMNT_0010770991 /DNA_START=218 /DNA_END=694 /DNA_ORIENTATION=-